MKKLHLYCDGSFRPSLEPNSDKISTGWICYDGSGMAILYSGRRTWKNFRGRSNSTAAELAAVAGAMDGLIRRMDNRSQGNCVYRINLIVHNDSCGVVKMLISSQTHEVYGRWVNSIRKKAKRFVQVDFAWVPRQSNTEAHNLAAR